MPHKNKSKEELISEIKKLKERLFEKTAKVPGYGVISGYEKRLAQSEEKLRAIYENASEAIMLVDTKGVVIEINHGIFNYPKSRYLGKSIYRIIPKKEFDWAQKNKRKKEYECSGIHDNGEKYWQTIRITPLINEKNTQNYVVTIFDITERKTSEEKIKEAEERFRKLSDSTFEGVLIHRDGKIIEANTGFSKMFGYSRKELIGKNAILFASKESQEIIKRKLTEKSEHPYEVEGKTKQGKYVRALIVGRQIVYKNQSARVTVIRDITKEKQDAQLLKESEERFKLLSDSAMEGVVLSENGKIIDANDRFLEMHGYKKLQEVVGKTFYNFALKEEYSKIKKALAKPESESYEIGSRKKDGTIIYVETRGREIPYKGKAIRVSVAIDITQRKLNEIELEQSREDYKSLVEASPNGVFIHDEKGKVLYANPAALSIVKLKSLKSAIGTSVFDYTHPDYIKAIKKRGEALKKTKDLPLLESKIITRTGEIKDVESRLIPITYGGKKAIQVIINDITAERKLEKEKIRAELAEDSAIRLQKEIEERKKTEEALTFSQEYTQNLIDSSIDIICAVNTKGEVSNMNPEGLKIFGYKKEEIIGKPAHLLYPSQEHRAQLEQALIESGKFRGEVLYKKKNGQTFTAFLSAAILKNKKEVIGVVGIAKDISEIKHTQDQLKKSEEKYRDIFENATDLMQSVDVEGRILYVNNAWKKALGYSDEEIATKNIFEFIHPDSKQHCLDAFQKIAKEGVGVNRIDVDFISKLGKKITTEGNVSVKIVNGKPESTRGIFRDLTDKKRAEEELRLQSEKLNAVVDNSSFTVWALDKNYKFTAFNNYFSDVANIIYGIKPQVGMAVHELINRSRTEEHKKIWIAKYKEVFSGKTVYFQTIVEDTKGVVRWREFYLKPVYGLKGEVIEITGMGQDITEKKQNEEKIKQSLLEKEMLIKEVHHRVKNNLQVISSILNLQSSYAKDDATLNLLRESQNRIKSMAFIHESLYQSKDLTKINFTEYITTLAQSLVHSYTSPEHKISLELDAEQAFLNLDTAIPCGLILNELVSNALKYAFKGQKEGVIKISLRKNREEISIVISDDGVGFPSEINFKDSPSLGLQLVNTLVDQINAKIQQKNNKGTEYIITFKL